MKHTILSIIVPMYNEEKTLDPFFSRVIPILSGITSVWEIICVDDGSKDATFKRIEAYAAKEPRIKLIKFSRNFGKEMALSAGFNEAAGDAIIPIDADLQDPPEVIIEMVEKWQEGFKVVLAVRETRTRKESLLKRGMAFLFYRVIHTIAYIPIPQHVGDFRLMDRQVVEVLKRLPERNRFMKGLFAWVGFSTTTLYYHREARCAGVPQQTFLKLWNHALDGIITFSTFPLKIWTYLGFITVAGSLLSFIHLLLRHPPSGYTPLITTIIFFGGVQLISLGVIGEYIARIYQETKQRPLYVIEKTIGL